MTAICMGYADNYGNVFPCGVQLRPSTGPDSGLITHGICGRCINKYMDCLAELRAEASNEKPAE